MIENVALCVACLVLGGFGGIALCRKYGCRVSCKVPAKKGKKR